MEYIGIRFCLPMGETLLTVCKSLRLILIIFNLRSPYSILSLISLRSIPYLCMQITLLKLKSSFKISRTFKNSFYALSYCFVELHNKANVKRHL